MRTINLRRIPDELFVSAKKAAIDAGISLREWVLKAMELKLGMAPNFKNWPVKPTREKLLAKIELVPHRDISGEEIKGAAEKLGGTVEFKEYSAEDRALAAFVKQYNRSPEPGEMEIFLKRGW